MTTRLQFLLIAVAGWMSRHQQAVIEYLQEENRILLEQLGGKPKRFTDAQRIRLARKAKLVGRRLLGQWATLVTPDILLRWFRVLVAKKWTYARTNPVPGELLIVAFEGLFGVPCRRRETVVLSRDHERVTVAACAFVDHACDGAWTWRGQDGRRPKSAPQTATADDPAEPGASS